MKMKRSVINEIAIVIALALMGAVGVVMMFGESELPMVADLIVRAAGGAVMAAAGALYESAYSRGLLPMIERLCRETDEV